MLTFYLIETVEQIEVGKEIVFKLNFNPIGKCIIQNWNNHNSGKQPTVYRFLNPLNVPVSNTV